MNINKGVKSLILNSCVVRMCGLYEVSSTRYNIEDTDDIPSKTHDYAYADAYLQGASHPYIWIKNVVIPFTVHYFKKGG